ncbi:MAG: hypothetical protein V7L31_08510 [Nostoc sp.]|uniref:hypothetical protein n=1 Tax=Nostoc sp. TaxID=1180 RepID=UPI002FF3821E
MLGNSQLSGFRIKQADFACIAANSIALTAAKPQGMREFINLENVMGTDPADEVIYDIRTANNYKRSPIITSSDP